MRLVTLSHVKSETLTLNTKLRSEAMESLNI